MHVEWVRDFCLTFKDVEECQPFGPEHLVYKIKGKMFLLLSLDEIPLRVNVKTDRERSIETVASRDSRGNSELSEGIKRIFTARGIILNFNERENTYKRNRAAYECFKNGTYKNWFKL